MIFGVLNPKKIWHQLLVHLPTSPVYCSRFTLRNQKSFFNSIIHTYVRLFMLSPKKTNCYSLTHHTWKMLPHNLVKCTNFSSFSFFHVYRVPICYTDELRNSSVLLWHGLNFSTAWWMIQLISGEKDWKLVSVQKVVTFIIIIIIIIYLFK